MRQVELRGLRKSFGDVAAVDGVDLTVPGGAITALVGPSGCGKTTLLRLIAGLEMPDDGEVVISGEMMAGAGYWVPPERRRVGMVFQHLALFPHLNVAGNVGYGLAALGRSERQARVAELLELVGLRGYERRYPDQLSGGQAQRVAVARALAPRPAVVLLDEPFSSLDVSLRGEIRAEVQRILRTEGVTAVLVTHDQEEALSFGDQVAVMLDGRLAQVGTPEGAYQRPASPAVALFLGEANLISGEVSAGVMHTELGPVELAADDGPAMVALRPEDLDLEMVPEGPNRVVEVHYYGHDQLVTVELPSGARVRARLAADRRFPVGSAVLARSISGRVVVFPGEQPRRSLDVQPRSSTRE
jgi:iron(III) transport system ATP-binding protein